MLNWLRNPDTAAKLERFPIGRNIFVRRKQSVPPLRASESYIASPLLRSIGGYARSRKGPRMESSREEKSALSGQSGKVEFTGESSRATEDVVNGEASATTVDSEPTQGVGASLFNLAESTTHKAPSGKTSRFARKRRGAISARHPPQGTTALDEGDAVTVAA